MLLAKIQPRLWVHNTHPRRVRRAYRRFKSKNQYDSPFLVIFCEAVIGVTTTLFVAASFFFGYRYLF